VRPYLLQHVLEESVARDPDKEAVRDSGGSLSYHELYLRSAALGSRLAEESPAAGDRVGILLDKSLDQVVSIFGALNADRVFVILNPVLKEPQIRHIVRDCSVRVLILAERFRGLGDELAREYPALRLIYQPELDGIIRERLGLRFSSRAISSDTATIIYTSGSTGRPKGIVLSHRNLLDGTRIVSRYLGLTENDRLLGLLPFNFDYGLNQLSTSVYTGASIVLFRYTMPATLLKTIDSERITGLAAIPTIWTSVFNPRLTKVETLAETYSFHSLRYITNSGGKLPVPVIKLIRRTFPHTRLFLMYGLTEAFRSTFLPPEEVDRRPESIGRAIPDVRVEVVREDGTVCAPGEEGELVHFGACVAKGYWNDPEKTAQVFRPNPLQEEGNRFLETAVYSGDLARRDEEGYLYFVGRKDSMIKSSGYRISPGEVEELLLGCDGVTEAVVFGLQDEALGQKIRAVVCLSDDEDTERIREHCRRTAPAYMVPREICVVRDMPKLSNGKIDRPKVVEESIARDGR